MTRRRLVALTLAAIAVLCGGVAAVVELDDPATEEPFAAEPSAPTPVLSPRRVPGLLAAPVADRRLGAALDDVLSLQQGTVCLSVASAGRVVYEHNAEVPLTPASLEKLFTAAAAIDVLGPDHRFRTSVVAGASPDDGVIAGDVWMVGSGDALLSTADYPLRFRQQPQPVTSVEALADAVAASGVTRIEGRLLGDESRYDDERYIDLWPQRFFDQDQTGPMSAVSVNDGWSTYPPSPDLRVPDEVPAPDPATHAAGVLAALLAERGVTVAGGVGSATAPAETVELGAVESVPLDQYVAHIVRTSDTHAAELLLKEIAVGAGRPGTSGDGAAVVAEVLGRLGLPDPAPIIIDGSGLASENRVTCAVVEGLLDALGPSDVAFQGLPVAGESGTLTLRFHDSPVTGRLRAKTGTLNQVSSLAGFVTTLPGVDLTFSFMVNLPPDLLVDEEELAVQDALAEAMAVYPEGPILEDLAPLPFEDG